MHVKDFVVMLSKMSNDEVAEIVRLQHEFEQSVDEVEFLMNDEGSSASPMLISLIETMKKTRARVLNYTQDMMRKYMN